MDPISLVVAALAILGIIIVSIYMYKTDENIKTDTNNKLTNIVKEVNVTQRANYNLDIKQEQLLKDMKNKIKTDSLEFNGSNNYTMKDRNNRLVFGSGNNTTMSMDTSNLYVDNIRPHKDNLNLGMMEMDSKSNMINFAASNININGKYRISDTSNLLSITGGKGTKLDKLQLGDKFTFSGVGDAHGNDNWLRMFNKDGTNYHGGMAMADLWVRDNAHLNGTVNVNGSTNFKGGSSEHNPHGWGTHFPWHGDNKNYIRGDTEMRGNTNNLGDLNVGRHLNTPSMGRKDGDWLRIHGTPAHGVALYNSLSVNDNGGINVGAWGRTPTGQVHANHFHSRGGMHTEGRINTNEQVHANHFHSRGGMHADGGIATNSTLFSGHPHIGGWSGANFRRRDGHWTHFDWVHDGRNYIRGNTTIDGHVHVNNNMSINRHIDAHENWHNNKKALFAGWGGDQVVLGSHKTGGHDFARDLPANTVVSVNPLHVHGNINSTSAVCINGTCMTQPELSRYKKTMPENGELCAKNTCMSEADLSRFKKTIPATNEVCANNVCTSATEFQRYKTSLPGDQVCVNNTCLNDTEIKQLKVAAAKPGEICINNTCINEENLRQIKMATSPLTSSSLLSQKVLSENVTTI